ncbi:MAG: DUF1002 domain-containing protein [Lachnospiraceae bacterium]|nr:DUF1002 domain-containing protein [Lachnospiraceae bacterium]
MKRILSLFIMAIMVMGVILPSVSASADAVTEKPYLSLGADLSESEKAKVLDLLGIDESDLDDYTVGTVTNAEEHDYLDSYVSSSVIGSRALSSVLVTLTEEGSGIDVETSNITYCTSGMYRNALVTAGISDATIQVAGPFNITGTAALVGVMKAYEDMTGEEISEESKDAATNELVATGEIAGSLGDTDTAEQLLALIKDKVVTEGLDSEEEILDAIDESCEELNVTLSDDDKQLLQELMDKISQLDLDTNQLKEQAEEIYNKLSDMGIDIKSESFWQSVKSWLNRVIDGITGLLS